MTYTNSSNGNPYVVGTPITRKEHLFGREKIFKEIDDFLHKSQRIVFLYGQRRIGKTSVLQQIPDFVTFSKSKYVYFDCQGFSSLSNRDSSHTSFLREILTSLIYQICEKVNLSLLPNFFVDDSYRELKCKNYDLIYFFSEFLNQVSDGCNGSHITLLVDELDAIDVYDSGNQSEQFFSFLRKSIHDFEKLSMIATIGRNKDNFGKLDRFFKDSPSILVSFLDNDSAKKIILDLNSMSNSGDYGNGKGHLDYEEEAIDTILELTANHPYLIQGICSTIFDYARSKHLYQISKQVVLDNVDKALKSCSGIKFFWKSRTETERLILFALAQTENPDSNIIKFANPITLLEEKGIEITEVIRQSIQALEAGEFIESKPEPDPSLIPKTSEYRIKIPVVSLWFREEYSFGDVIRGLEESNELACDLFEKARRQDEHNYRPEALSLYSQVLVHNPNHLLAIERIAELKFHEEEYTESLKYYARATKLDAACINELVKVQAAFCRILVKSHKDYDKAKELLEGLAKQYTNPSSQDSDFTIQNLSETIISLIQDIKLIENKYVSDSTLLNPQPSEKSFSFNPVTLVFDALKYTTLKIFNINLRERLFLISLLTTLPLISTYFVWKDYQSNRASNVLSSAQNLFDNGDYVAAIEKLKEIPPYTSHYTHAQKELTDYSERMFEEAIKSVEASQNFDDRVFWEATWMLNQIPQGTPAYSKAKETINQYAEPRKLRR